MLRLLPKRHREVIVRRYGLGDEGAQPHAHIGRRLGVGEERSCQLEREALLPLTFDRSRVDTSRRDHQMRAMHT